MNYLQDVVVMLLLSLDLTLLGTGVSGKQINSKAVPGSECFELTGGSGSTVRVFDFEFAESWFHARSGQQYLHWRLVWDVADACVYLAFSESTREMSKNISGRGVINLAHRQSSWTPLIQMSANLSDVTSIRSFFEFRTLDPEGAIFYGDTKEGQDWFVLSLREGIPEMQIGKADILVSVTGGHQLNDGAWHLLELRSEGKFVVLEVNNKVELVVGLHSELAEEELTGKIRLGLGGMLVDKQKLFHPFQPEMDACIRGGQWLNLSTLWDTDPTWEPRPCFSEIRRGSYFPGSGVVTFNTSDLPGLKTEEAGITVEIFGSWTGTTLSLQGTGFEYVLGALDGHTDAKEVQLGLKEESETTALPHEPAALSFTVLKHSLVVNSKPEHEMESLDFFSMWKEGMLLTFGGVPGESEAAKSSQHLRGCLEKILIQGQAIDLDRALYKHPAVSSHSCPTEVMNELT